MQNETNLPTSWEQAYQAFKKMELADPFYKALQQRKPEDLSAFDKLAIIARVMRGDWFADYSNWDLEKWFPIFEWDESVAGFVFSYTGYGYRRASAVGGPRLASKNEEIAEYFGTHPEFLELWKEFLTEKQ